MKIKLKHTMLFADYVALFFLLFGIGRIIWSGYNTVLFLVSIVWVVLRISWIVKFSFLKNRGFVSYFIFIILYAIFLIASGNRGNAVSYGGTYVIYCVLILMSEFYLSKARKNRLNIIIKIVMGWIGVMCVCAILYYEKYPGAARLYETHRSDLNGYMIGGGYQLAYICAMLLPVCGRYSINRKLKSWHTLLSLAMIILIMRTSSMIIILIAIVGCGVEYAFSKQGKKRIYVLLGIGLLGLLLYLMRVNIGQLLIDIAGGRKVTSFADMNNAVFVRMTEIGMIFKGISVGESSATGLRIQNYLRPINEIVNHPFLGGILKYGVSPESGVFNDSTIITALSCWGIPIGCLHLYPFLYFFKMYISHKGVMVVVILTLLLNPSMGFSVVAGAWFVLPALDKVYMENINTGVTR